MPCTTILVGKNATYDGSTMMARNEDSPSGSFTPKKWIVVNPKDQPRKYQSVLTKFHMDLPEEPLRYTAMPNALPEEGFWGEAGINEANVAMSETETITSNDRVLGADPLVKDGIGEEDMLLLVLPYIRSAREGVLRLGKLLETCGTCELNGIGFQDVHEIWWFESIGGHHWMAKRVPDDAYVVMPNQLGIDTLDLADALGEGKNYMCSSDLADFISENHLDLSMTKEGPFDSRSAFGSRSDSAHTYNTPRAWYMLSYFNPHAFLPGGPLSSMTPESDDLPWSYVPEKKIAVDDVKYVLSSHYQGTPYDCYGGKGDEHSRNRYRPIGINRNNFLALTQLRPYMPPERMAVEWLAVSCNVFNSFIPFYANVTKTPSYISETGKIPDSQQFYWAIRFISALADSHFGSTSSSIERYIAATSNRACALLAASDKAPVEGDIHSFLESCNEKMAAMAKEETNKCLDQVLYTASLEMKNSFARSDS